ncbi:MAG: hypothetical protein IPJ27_11005 [Candidatus Accumulibacter sp.]|uniref:Uncharacterized protein n=1 Tax=Candidatus Accumulibacter proximus TaxID=2954385 RepID=A0A935PZC5_9PROT|nr:hypothetical protein [Candidatus Accumulibacter proximus]
MSDDSDLISRANSLINADAGTAGSGREISRRMRRRRSFLASTIANDTADGLSPPARAGDDDDDLPVLTEVVLAARTTSEEEFVNPRDNLRPALAADLAHHIDRQLSSELPMLIEVTLRNAAAQLRLGIDAVIETAVQDFLAERGQLRLPLEHRVTGEEAAADQA